MMMFRVGFGRTSLHYHDGRGSLKHPVLVLTNAGHEYGCETSKAVKKQSEGSSIIIDDSCKYFAAGLMSIPRHRDTHRFQE